MKILRKLASTAALPALLALPLFGCGRSTPTTTSDAPAIPASSDPEGKDLVEGAVVAAYESSGGYRLYKIIHVADLPDPIGYEYDMIAYDPKGATFEEAAQLWKKGAVKVVMDHVNVRLVFFGPRDHRVLAVEKITDAEKAPYLRSRDSRH